MAAPKRTRSKRSDKDLDWRQLVGELGPGLVTGASDDDPSGIATYAQVGTQFGYSMLWTAPLTFPLMATVQYVCAKIGIVTGRGLAGVLAVPILAASASYAVSEVVGWRRGLDRKPNNARRFYALIVAGMFIGMLTQFVGVDPIAALF